MTPAAPRYFQIPEDTVYLLLGILRLEKDGIHNPMSNIELAFEELGKYTKGFCPTNAAQALRCPAVEFTSEEGIMICHLGKEWKCPKQIHVPDNEEPLCESQPAAQAPPASSEPMYQCSVCTRNKYNGDKSCPLDLDGVHGNSDIFDGINRVIKSCGCGAFIDPRARGPVAAPCGNVSPICSAMEIKKYPGDQFVLCKSSQPCTYQRKSSVGMTIFCDHPSVTQQAPVAKQSEIQMLQNLDAHLYAKQQEHDAALIAQEREKWERERDQALPVETCPICDIATSCDHHFGVNGYPPCVQRAAARAREDVLKDAAIAILKEAGIPETSVSHYTPKHDSDIPSIRVDKVVHILESLRSKAEK